MKPTLWATSPKLNLNTSILESLLYRQPSSDLSRGLSKQASSIFSKTQKNSTQKEMFIKNQNLSDPYTQLKRRDNIENQNYSSSVSRVSIINELTRQQKSKVPKNKLQNTNIQRIEVEEELIFYALLEQIKQQKSHKLENLKKCKNYKQEKQQIQQNVDQRIQKETEDYKIRTQKRIQELYLTQNISERGYNAFLDSQHQESSRTNDALRSSTSNSVESLRNSSKQKHSTTFDLKTNYKKIQTLISSLKKQTYPIKQKFTVRFKNQSILINQDGTPNDEAPQLVERKNQPLNKRDYSRGKINPSKKFTDYF